MKVLIWLLLLVLGVLHQTKESLSLSGFCEDDEDVKPTKNNIQWSPGGIYWSICAEGYKKDLDGNCNLCADGFGLNEHNNCVHCNETNERWCRWYGKCICAKNFARNNWGECKPCGKHEESNGLDKCVCSEGFERNIFGNCACGTNKLSNVGFKMGEMQDPIKYNSISVEEPGDPTVIICFGLVGILLVGLICGIIVRQRKN